MLAAPSLQVPADQERRAELGQSLSTATMSCWPPAPTIMFPQPSEAGTYVGRLGEVTEDEVMEPRTKVHYLKVCRR